VLIVLGIIFFYLLYRRAQRERALMPQLDSSSVDLDYGVGHTVSGHAPSDVPLVSGVEEFAYGKIHIPVSASSDADDEVDGSAVPPTVDATEDPSIPHSTSAYVPPLAVGRGAF